MTYSGTAFEASGWLSYELALVAAACSLLLFWLLLSCFKKQGWFSWVVVILFSGALIGVCGYSRIHAMQLAVMLSQGQAIEIIDGEFHYGKYHFPYMAEHGIDYREIHLDDRTLKLYHSGYLPNTRCYRNFYSNNEFAEDVNLRLYIHWFESDYDYRQQTFKLRAPCILKIEHLQRGKLETSGSLAALNSL